MLKFPDIEDITVPDAPPPVSWDWLWWVLAGLVALTYILVLVSRISAARGRLRPPALPGAPMALALADLDKLGARSGILDRADFAGELTEIIRVFLHRQAGILAKFSTSPEILGDRRRTNAPPPPVRVGAFRAVLEACDAVKFGPAAAAEPAARAALLDQARLAVAEMAEPATPPPSLPPAAPVPVPSPSGNVS